MFWLSICSVALLPAAFAHPYDDGHSHIVKKALPGSWYHERDHPVHALFRRDDTLHLALQNSWPLTPDLNNLPKEWTDALAAAVAAGKIPDVPVSTLDNDNPVYPDGLDPTGDVVCSATYKCRTKGDIWDAPDGVFGAGFDDGPLPPSPKLYDFLAQNKVTATHFMIGQNIMWYPDIFMQAYNSSGDIAVHTWSHPHMTTLTNACGVIAELGYTMKIIHDSTGGRLPRYWRPPYGDSDNRVRAIAETVFGLKAIIWNQDTADWTLTVQGGTSLNAIADNMHTWLTGPKSPGLIILEHELSDKSVAAFIAAFPTIQSKNAAANTGDVISQDVAASAVSSNTSSSSLASSSAAVSTTIHAALSAAKTASHASALPTSSQQNQATSDARTNFDHADITTTWAVFTLVVLSSALRL